ncbi:MAG: glycosyltransferase family 4 protein, partial [Thermoplasmata archaeon]|nr:glycosyltransferase family 4 protein [Thermoplasmata archaeon]
TFLGRLERSAYRAVFRAARTFVLPSEWEAYGLVLLEAMAADRPILATSVGGVPEVLEHGECGLLVPYGDVPALADAIARLQQDDPQRARLVAAGRRRVQELTWSRCVERHRALYRSLAA